MATEVTDDASMRRALELAYRGTGNVSPNPRVGCVVVSDNKIIAEGWHSQYGEAHAEINALKQLVRPAPPHATMYVTLEPCSHHGKTAPCADAIIASGIKKVVVGMIDPYHEVSGRGISKMRDNGIDVRVGDLAVECLWMNRFFVKHVTTGMPYVILKLAQSIDGFVASSDNSRMDMTGSDTQKMVHTLRNEVDAVMIGIGTVLADDPQLSVRNVVGRDPARIIIDPLCNTPPECRLMQTAHKNRTIVITSSRADSDKVKGLEDIGVEIRIFPTDVSVFIENNAIDLAAVLRTLASEDQLQAPITSVMCEGGPVLAQHLLESDLVDEQRIHTANMLIHNGRRMNCKQTTRKSSLRTAVRSGSDILATYVLKTIIALVALISLQTTAESQSSMPSSSLRLIDTSLSILGMTRADCAMPPDLLDRDKHRTALHDSLFTQPFDAATVADDYANIRATDGDSFVAWISRAMVDMNLGTYRTADLDATAGTLPMSTLLGVDLSKHMKQASARFFDRFVKPMLAAHAHITGVQRTWRTQTSVYTLCDSLWMNTQENDDLSLWDAYQEEQRSRRTAETFFAIADPLQNQLVYIYGAALYVKYMDLVNESNAFVLSGRDSVTTVIIETNLGRVALGGPGDDVYSGHYALIVDVGGNDVYISSKHDSLSHSKLEAASTPAACIIDYDGNDAYIGSDYSFGTGVGGIGILIDVRGNDTYSAGDFSLGCGLFGIGVVNDMSGDDSYSSGQNTQGAGIFGIGVHIDGAGNDIYRAHAQAQGFGATRGIGMLADVAGNDHYIAASPFVDALRYATHYTTFAQGAALGFRPVASGGIGILFDRSGNDSYSTDIYGQGTGYWFGMGALIDRSGEDRYTSYQYAQGAGVHFATGILADSSGSDVYVSHGVSQGCGHDIGIGILVDNSGNDSYVVESLSLGGGNANAVSVFVDASGDDSYIARDTSNTMGFSDFRRWYGMIGVFADGEGDDVYSTAKGNGTVRVQSTYGVFFDADDTQDDIKDVATPKYVNLSLESKPDQLFVQASAAPLKYQNNVGPARDSLARMGRSILPMLESYIGTTMPRERLTLEHVFPLIYKQFPSDVDSVLIRALQSEKIDVVAQAATIAGKVRSTKTVPTFVEMLHDSSWRFRRIAALSLGQIGDTTILLSLTTPLTDTHPYVRARAAYAIGELGGRGALSTLQRTLADRSAIVRYSAVEGLNRGARRNVAELKPVWNRMSRNTKPSSLRLIASCDTTEANAKDFAAYYATTRNDVRVEIQRLLPSMPSFWQRALASRPKKLGR